MKDLQLRQEIIATAGKFNQTGLSVGTSGNLSVQTDSHILITPSGMPYQDLTPEDIVELDRDGRVVSGSRKPSSEWRFHRDIYLQRPAVNAVVHVHSPYATAVACTRRDIPAFHYMIAAVGGDSIRCAEYATFGTEALSNNAVTALAGRHACLLANHGMIATGADLRSAIEMAQLVEELARQYYLSCRMGDPVILDTEEMRINLEKFRSYGKQDDTP